MFRLSTLPRTRDSVFTGGSEQYRGDANAICPPNLRECVLAMEDCCEEVHSESLIQLFLMLLTYTRHMKHNNYFETGHLTYPE